MRIILDAFEHQSTKSLSIARLCQRGPTRYGTRGRAHPVTFSIAKGSFRHPTSNRSDKTLGNQYDLVTRLLGGLRSHENPQARRHIRLNGYAGSSAHNRTQSAWHHGGRDARSPVNSRPKPFVEPIIVQSEPVICFSSTQCATFTAWVREHFSQSCWLWAWPWRSWTQ
jgi:hypothetical protein